MFILIPESFENIDSIIQAAPDEIAAGLNPLCEKCSARLETADLQAWIEKLHASGISAAFLVDGMVHQENLENTKKVFFQALDAGADTFYIADEAYIEMALEYEDTTGREAVNRLVFQPETLICCGQEGAFYESLGLKAVSLMPALSLDEAAKSAQDCTILEVLASGHPCWMNSHRPLLSNYFDAARLHTPFQPGHVYHLKEKNRPYSLPVWQDEKGTHIFSAVPVNSVRQVKQLQESGISRFRIDCLFESNAWGIRQLALLRQALEGRMPQLNEKDGSDQGWSMKTDIRKKANDER